VKKRDLEKQLRKLGWYFSKHGGEHDHWTNGKEFESVPRHSEINENLARKILRTAKNYPPRRNNGIRR
jgi:mRNA interferase HicA